jgi:hypothetical protein
MIMTYIVPTMTNNPHVYIVGSIQNRYISIKSLVYTITYELEMPIYHLLTHTIE